MNMKNSSSFILLFALVFILFYSQGDVLIISQRFIWLCISGLFLYGINRSIGMTKITTFLGLLWFTATPWVIEQSFRLTPVHAMSTLVLLSVFLSLLFKRWYISWIISLTYIFWQQSQGGSPSLSVIVTNVQRFFSFELLFFKNTILGRLNAIGVFYPESLPLFLIGVFQGLQRKKIMIVLALLIPWFFIAALGRFGEEFFIFLPFFSIFFALGIESIYKTITMKNRGNIASIVSMFYGLLLLYGIVNFYHYFTNHYLIFDRGL